MTISFNTSKINISNLDATYPIECDSMEELKNKIVECSHRESAEFRISKQDINKAEIFVDSCTADNMTEVWFDYNVYRNLVFIGRYKDLSIKDGEKILEIVKNYLEV